MENNKSNKQFTEDEDCNKTSVDKSQLQTPQKQQQFQSEEKKSDDQEEQFQQPQSNVTNNNDALMNTFLNNNGDQHNNLINNNINNVMAQSPSFQKFCSLLSPLPTKQIPFSPFLMQKQTLGCDIFDNHDDKLNQFQTPSPSKKFSSRDDSNILGSLGNRLLKKMDFSDTKNNHNHCKDHNDSHFGIFDQEKNDLLEEEFQNNSNGIQQNQRKTSLFKNSSTNKEKVGQMNQNSAGGTLKKYPKTLFSNSQYSSSKPTPVKPILFSRENSKTVYSQSAKPTPVQSNIKTAPSSTYKNGDDETNGLDNSDIQQSSQKKKITCNCKKSQCLKLYCECFQAKQYCQDCNCINCCNIPSKEEERQKVMQELEARNPQAFTPKIPTKDTSLKGCNCKKSNCQKKYCECFQAGVACTSLCKCEECKNSKDNKCDEHQEYSHSQPLPGQSYPPQSMIPPPYGYQGMEQYPGEGYGPIPPYPYGEYYGYPPYQCTDPNCQQCPPIPPPQYEESRSQMNTSQKRQGPPLYQFPTSSGKKIKNEDGLHGHQQQQQLQYQGYYAPPPQEYFYSQGYQQQIPPYYSHPYGYPPHYNQYRMYPQQSQYDEKSMRGQYSDKKVISKHMKFSEEIENQGENEQIDQEDNSSISSKNTNNNTGSKQKQKQRITSQKSSGKKLSLKKTPSPFEPEINTNSQNFIQMKQQQNSQQFLQQQKFQPLEGQDEDTIYNVNSQKSINSQQETEQQQQIQQQQFTTPLPQHKKRKISSEQKNSSQKIENQINDQIQNQQQKQQYNQFATPQNQNQENSTMNTNSFKKKKNSKIEEKSKKHIESLHLFPVATNKQIEKIQDDVEEELGDQQISTVKKSKRQQQKKPKNYKEMNKFNINQVEGKAQ